MIDWAVGYMQSVSTHAVRSQVKAGDIVSALPDNAPTFVENFDTVMNDLNDKIMPGITHWQHPRFLAYFPANVLPESQIADMAIAALGVNSMLWETSPAATELEVVVTNWLRNIMGLPDHFKGMIQDTASNATFSAMVTARELATGSSANRIGLQTMPTLAVYVSGEAHSSIEKAARLAGMGSASIRYIETDDTRAMCPVALQKQIEKDIEDGVKPALLVVTQGGTGVGAFDRAHEIIPIAKQFDCYVHVDAAWAGSAMICPEFQTLFKGCELADSFVFNPHKWLGIGFDCSVQFLANPSQQQQALMIKPAYLDSDVDMPNYSEWSPVLGRRMRALKIWFVLRLVGIKALQTMIINHVDWTQKAADYIDQQDGFKIITQPNLALFTVHYKDNDTTEALLNAVNNDGFTYVTRTNVDGKRVIRIAIGVWTSSYDDIMESMKRIVEIAHRHF